MNVDTLLLGSIIVAGLVSLWLCLRIWFAIRADEKARASQVYGRPYDRPAPWEHDGKPRPNIRRA